MLTQARLKELLHYNEDSGEFTWLVARQCVQVGAVAGTINNSGYVCIRVDLIKYYAHRLAWMYVYGDWPNGLIDHINRNPSDNSLENLRPATYRQNFRNVSVSPKSTTGVKGVTAYGKTGRFRAMIRVGDKRLSLGLFDTVEDAAAAYKSAAIKHHGEFAHFK